MSMAVLSTLNAPVIARVLNLPTFLDTWIPRLQPESLTHSFFSGFSKSPSYEKETSSNDSILGIYLLTDFSIPARKVYPTSFLSPSCILTRFCHPLELASAEMIWLGEHFILAFENGVGWSLLSVYCKEHQQNKNVQFEAMDPVQFQIKAEALLIQDRVLAGVQEQRSGEPGPRWLLPPNGPPAFDGHKSLEELLAWPFAGVILRTLLLFGKNKSTSCKETSVWTDFP